MVGPGGGSGTCEFQYSRQGGGWRPTGNSTGTGCSLPTVPAPSGTVITVNCVTGQVTAIELPSNPEPLTSPPTECCIFTMTSNGWSEERHDNCTSCDNSTDGTRNGRVTEGTKIYRKCSNDGSDGEAVAISC